MSWSQITWLKVIERWGQGEFRGDLSLMNLSNELLTWQGPVSNIDMHQGLVIITLEWMAQRNGRQWTKHWTSSVELNPKQNPPSVNDRGILSFALPGKIQGTIYHDDSNRLKPEQVIGL